MQLLGDLGCRVAFAHALEHSEFALAEEVRSVHGSGREMTDSFVSAPHRVGEWGDAPPLVDERHTASSHHLVDDRVAGERTHADHGRCGVDGLEILCEVGAGLAVDAVVDDHDVRQQCRALLDCLGSCWCGADDLDVGFLVDGESDAFEQHLVIIDDDEADQRGRTGVGRSTPRE